MRGGPRSTAGPSSSPRSCWPAWRWAPGSGTLRRSTAALQRRGIIGWTVRQSVFQRRAGLVTVGATTAAGAGVYAIRDVGADAGLDAAEAAVPELLTPFLEPAQAATRAASPV